VVAWIFAGLINWLLYPIIFLAVNAMYLITYVVAWLFAGLINWIVKPLLYLVVNGFYLAGYLMAVLLVVVLGFFVWVFDVAMYLLDWLGYFITPLYDLLAFLAYMWDGINALLWPFLWAWDFSSTVIIGLAALFLNPPTGAQLNMPTEYKDSFDFLYDNTGIDTLATLLTGLLWFFAVRWALGQFSSMNT